MASETDQARDIFDHSGLLATGYLGSLLRSAPIVRYLAQHHPPLLAEFQKITDL